MKKTSNVLLPIDQSETAGVTGGYQITSPDPARLTQPKKPIRYYTQAIGEDGGDLPDLLTM